MSENETTNLGALVGSMARDIAARVDWEAELGVAGYPIAASTTGALATGATRLEEAGDKAARLIELRAKIGDCQRCPLASGRTKLVFGDGDPDADLVFVGEGPGHDEDISGLPFVGVAGQLLTKIIEAIGLERSKVYICNIVKCRPPNNRDPAPEETAACGPFVLSQLEIIRPKVVVALGRPSAQFLLRTDRPIGQLRGSFHQIDELKVMPTYHPAYLLRNPSGKRAVWEDMKKVRAELGLDEGTTR